MITPFPFPMDLISRDRGIPDDSGDPLEIGVIAGQTCQPVVMHHSRDQGVAAGETVLKAQVCGKENMLLRDRNHLNSDPDDLIERLAESLEFYDLTRMAAEA